MTDTLADLVRRMDAASRKWRKLDRGPEKAAALKDAVRLSHEFQELRDKLAWEADDLRQRIAALEAERDKWKKGSDQFWKLSQEAIDVAVERQQRITELEAENERLRRVAEQLANLIANPPQTGQLVDGQVPGPGGGDE